MIELHERLSEFSYGYGVTRETEGLLHGQGLRAIPFLPNLIDEADLGFDVAFDRPGAVLLLQFKLGQSLKRFRRSDPSAQPPILTKPFWRFKIDTAEPDGQFETLLKAEADDAEVHYVAPRFSDWLQYGKLFEAREVLDNSVLVRPSEIRAAIDAQGGTDGLHRIVYDRSRVYVCSTPERVGGSGADDLARDVAVAVRQKGRTAGEVLQQMLDGFEDRSQIRRKRRTDAITQVADDQVVAEDEMGRRATRHEVLGERTRRLEQLLVRARSRDHAVAAAVGLELWSLGIQLIVAVDEG